MKCPIHILMTLFCAAPLCRADWARYQIILDRRPFGEPAAEASAAQTPQTVAVAQSFAKAMRLCTLFEGFDGDLRAGLVDGASRKNFVIRLGETVQGIELVSADLSTASATLRKGTETVTLKMAAAPESEKPAPAPQPAQTNSYEERRRARLQRIMEARKRRQEEQEEKPEQPQLTGEALKEHLRNYQMEVIRKGMPPLPIPLTPEMDNQLVEEGVLPPQ